MWEIHLPLFVATEAPLTIISICAWAKWLQNNNKLERFQDNISHPLCTCCESPYKQHSPGEQDLPVLLPCPGLLSENETVPNEFNNPGRLKRHWHHAEVRSLPGLYTHSRSGGDLHFLIQVLLFHPLDWNADNCQGSRIPQHPAAKGTSEGLFLCRLPPLRHKGTATVPATCPVSPPIYSE